MLKGQIFTLLMLLWIVLTPCTTATCVCWVVVVEFTRTERLQEMMRLINHMQVVSDCSITGLENYIPIPIKELENWLLKDFVSD